MNIKAPKGTRDIFGEETYYWHKFEKTVIDVCNTYNIEEIRTPMFEHTELFTRGVGETTDIVQKEMYTFNDKGNRSITLRPEGTAAVCRAYVENGLYLNKLPVKVFYLIQAFRYENTQADRYRQFSQFGVEFLGTEAPSSDAECISVAYRLLEELGITSNMRLEINSLGGKECRQKYNDALISFLKERYDKLCPICQDRYERNPLRVLDCKEDSCQEALIGAPLTSDLLGPECKKKFEMIQQLLTEMKIPFSVNPKLVRGLDYYTNTVFEFYLDEIQGAIVGGGRYDGLVEEIGGPSTPSVGFAMGIDRMVTALKKRNIDVNIPVCEIYIGSIGEKGANKSHVLAYELRAKGIICESDILGRTVKSQMKYANTIGAKFSVVLGDDEINNNKANLKNMSTGESFEVSLDSLYDFLKKN